MPTDLLTKPQTENATWEKFLGGLGGLATQGGRGTSMKRVVAELQDAAASREVTDTAFQEHVGELLRTHGEELGIRGEDREKILEGAANWRKTNFPQQPTATPELPATPAPAGPSLKDFLPKEEKSHGGHNDREALDKMAADEKLKTTIKGSVEQEFDKLLSTTPQDKLPDAVEAFYHQHLSAAGVLGSQYNILLKQSRELYRPKEELDLHGDALVEAQKKQEEFDLHEDAISKQVGDKKARLDEVRQIGPIRPPKNKEAETEYQQLYRQRDIERANIRNLQMIATNSKKEKLQENMKSAMSQVFEAEWRRRQDDAVIEKFFNEFKRYVPSRVTLVTEIFAEGALGVAATTATTTYQQQEPGTTISSQGSTFLRGSQPSGSSAMRNIGNRAGNALKNQLKKAEKKAAEELGEQALAKSGLSAFVSSIGGWPVVLAIAAAILIFIFVFAVIIMVILGQLNQTTTTTAQPTAIPGLTLNVTNPSSVPNGQNIQYTIDVIYTGTDSITITDTIPTNASEVANSVTGITQVHTSGVVSWLLDKNTPIPTAGRVISPSKHYQFTITLHPTQKDVRVSNVITATYTNGGPSSTSSTTTPPSSGYCSEQYLAPYFGKDAKTASCVCKAESRGGDPRALNTNCLTGNPRDHGDYSAGLFQMNMLVHALNYSCNTSFVTQGFYCKIVDQQRLDRCKNDMFNPVNNIKAAVILFNANGRDWNGPWAADKKQCGF